MSSLSNECMLGNYKENIVYKSLVGNTHFHALLIAHDFECTIVSHLSLQIVYQKLVDIFISIDNQLDDVCMKL